MLQKEQPAGHNLEIKSMIDLDHSGMGTKQKKKQKKVLHISTVVRNSILED